MSNKLPTAEESLKLFPPVPTNLVAPNYYHHETVVAAIESHTAAHTAGLRERVKELEDRVKELEIGNNRILNEVNEINQLTKQSRVNVTMRIIELETKNDRLCEALKKIADRFDPETQDFEGIIRIAEEALKQQDNETDNTGD